MIREIDICNRQHRLAVNTTELTEAITCGLEVEQVAAAVLSVSIVDNAEIHRINREYLQHDCPTDVISFPLEFRRRQGSRLRKTGAKAVPGGLRAAGATIEGEIIVSAEMACEMAPRGRWTPQSELKLYLIHGMLHICGYDDLTLPEQEIMRYHEKLILCRLGLMSAETPWSADDPSAGVSAAGVSAAGASAAGEPAADASVARAPATDGNTAQREQHRE